MNLFAARGPILSRFFCALRDDHLDYNPIDTAGTTGPFANNPVVGVDVADLNAVLAGLCVACG